MNPMPPPAVPSILIPVHDFGLGGSERIAIRLANRWAAAGRKVRIVCGDAQGPLRALVDPGVAVVPLSPPIRRSPGSRRRLGAAVRDLVAREPSDLVFIPGNFHFRLLPPLLRMAPETRPLLVAKLSNPIVRAGRGLVDRLRFEWRVGRVLRGLDAVVAMSPALADDARSALGLGNCRIIAQPTLPDEPEAPALARGAGLLSAGRLVEQKDFALTIAAFAALKRKDATLTIVGEGPERAALAALAAMLGVADRVSMPGYVPHLGPSLRAARLLVLTSRYEGYPAVAVEALAAGVPVVATDCSPAIGEILADSAAGTVVRSRDPAALASAIADGLDRAPPDPERLAASVARHRIGPIAAEYLALFDELQSARRTSR